MGEVFEMILRGILETVGDVVFSPAPLYKNENPVFRYGCLVLLGITLISVISFWFFELCSEWQYKSVVVWGLAGIMVLCAMIRWMLFWTRDGK